MSICIGAPHREPPGELLLWVAQQYLRWVRGELLPEQYAKLSIPSMNYHIKFRNWSIDIAKKQKMTVGEWEDMVRGASRHDIEELAGLLAKMNLI